MTGCQGLVCVRFPGQQAIEAALPAEEHRSFEACRMVLFEEPLLDEEAYSLDHWLDLNA